MKKAIRGRGRLLRGWQPVRSRRPWGRPHRSLSLTHLSRILSEASIGKAYLKQMNIWPWRELQPDMPNELIGLIVSTYFGGRAEVHLRRVVCQVFYCDFLSMYPTVCTLMGLWRFELLLSSRLGQNLLIFR